MCCSGVSRPADRKRPEDHAFKKSPREASWTAPVPGAFACHSWDRARFMEADDVRVRALNSFATAPWKTQPSERILSSAQRPSFQSAPKNSLQRICNKLWSNVPSDLAGICADISGDVVDALQRSKVHPKGNGSDSTALVGARSLRLLLRMCMLDVLLN